METTLEERFDELPINIGHLSEANWRPKTSREIVLAFIRSELAAQLERVREIVRKQLAMAEQYPAIAAIGAPYYNVGYNTALKETLVLLDEELTKLK